MVEERTQYLAMSLRQWEMTGSRVKAEAHIERFSYTRWFVKEGNLCKKNTSIQFQY